ncbi:MAG: DUF2189 domain-containing protein [Betaproteobacteria bacterium]|nr:DUF2189 domain-containing protein [Betaproteobacteria bacterium]
MEAPVSRKLALSRINHWLGDGWQMFRRIQTASMVYAGMFALIGVFLLAGVVALDLAPMAFPLAGGFMLVGPAILVGFFNAAKIQASGRNARLADFFAGFRQSPPAQWVLAVVCMFLFLIWLTDAAIVYSLYFGTVPVLSALEFFSVFGKGGRWLSFLLFSSVTGALLAFMIFAISAFSVPLIHDRRIELAKAVSASVRAVFRNFGLMIAWGVILTVGVAGSILLLMPLFVVALPVLAFASERAYREIFA